MLKPLKEQIEVISCDGIEVMHMPEVCVSYVVTSLEDLQSLFQQARELGVEWYTAQEMIYDPTDPIAKEIVSRGAIELLFYDGHNINKKMTIYAVWTSYYGC